MYTALYRRYRPGTFDEMAGQAHVVKILKNQIKTGNTAHAYLFCGTRGTGKTSAARIFAKGVNCLSEGEKPCGECENCVSIQNGTFFDVIEIDAASNNGVDNIRELRESVKYPPAAGLCKVYIIDEVHMLSQGAFNALLKTLEEPPSHVIFILATTEPHKLPATILSRCLRLDFRRVPEKEVGHKLRQICDELEIEYDESALSLIASAGDGSVRDSLSILEQCIPAGEQELTRKGVVEVLGTAGEDAFIEITQMVSESRTTDALLLIDRISEEGKDLRQFTRDWVFHFRNLMISKFDSKLDSIMNMSCENAEKVKEQGLKINQNFISGAISELSKTSNQMRWSTQPRTLLELSVFKLSSPELNDDIEFMLQRIEKLERSVAEYGSLPAQPDAAQERTSKQTAAASENTLPPWDLQQERPPEQPKAAQAAKSAPAEKASSITALSMSDHSTKTENTKSSNQDSNPKAARIWEAAFGKAVLDRPSLNMLKGHLKAVGLDEKVLTLSALSPVMKRYAEQNKEYLEKKINEELEREINIEVILSDEKPVKTASDTSKTMVQTIGKLNELLGADKLTISD